MKMLFSIILMMFSGLISSQNSGTFKVSRMNVKTFRRNVSTRVLAHAHLITTRCILEKAQICIGLALLNPYLYD